jgi:hypothetical protein
MNQILKFREISVFLFIQKFQNYLMINKNISKLNVDEKELT